LPSRPAGRGLLLAPLQLLIEGRNLIPQLEKHALDVVELARPARPVARRGPACLALDVGAGSFMPTRLSSYTFFSAVALAIILCTLDLEGK